MYLGIIKEYESEKCIKIALEKKGFFASDYYEARIYTTQPKHKVPIDQKELHKIGLLIMGNNWLNDQNNQGYTHSVKLKDYPNLTIRIKKIDKPNLQENEATD